MDPFAYELLSQPLPPGFDPVSGCIDAMDMEQLDNYFRAIGVLPPLPPANSHVQPAPAASSYDDDGAAALATYEAMTTIATMTTTSTPASGPWRQTPGTGRRRAPLTRWRVRR